MATRIYLREVARCAKSKFKDGVGSSRASSDACVILEIDQRTRKIIVIKNRYGACGVLA